MGQHSAKMPTVYWGCRCKTFVVKTPLKWSKKICAVCESNILEHIRE